MAHRHGAAAGLRAGSAARRRAGAGARGVHRGAADDERVGLAGRHAARGDERDERRAGVDAARRAALRLRDEALHLGAVVADLPARRRGQRAVKRPRVERVEQQRRGLREQSSAERAPPPPPTRMRSGVRSAHTTPATASVTSSGSLGTTTLRPVPGLTIVSVIASAPAARRGERAQQRRLARPRGAATARRRRRRAAAGGSRPPAPTRRPELERLAGLHLRLDDLAPEARCRRAP